MSINERVQSLEEKIAYVQKNISDIEAILNDFDRSLVAMAAVVEATSESGPSDRMVGTDRVWNCEKCGARLGVYDSDSDQLRIKYKDFSLYSVPGKGGSLTVPCRRCAHLNTLEDDR